MISKHLPRPVGALRRRRVATGIVASVFALSAMALGDLGAQEFHFTHGVAEGGQVKTNDVFWNVPTTLTPVPSSTLSVTLAPGDDDLFVLEFNAECAHTGTGWVEVKAFISVGFLAFQELEPGDSGGMAFCSAGTFINTHAKSWAVRRSGGSSGSSHTFSVWARVSGTGTAVLDDRTVKVTRYD
jgi:hypothetical protein